MQKKNSPFNMAHQPGQRQGIKVICGQMRHRSEVKCQLSGSQKDTEWAHPLRLSIWMESEHKEDHLLTLQAGAKLKQAAEQG